jgi:hypothetical protein
MDARPLGASNLLSSGRGDHGRQRMSRSPIIPFDFVQAVEELRSPASGESTRAKRVALPEKVVYKVPKT